MESRPKSLVLIVILAVAAIVLAAFVISKLGTPAIKIARAGFW